MYRAGCTASPTNSRMRLTAGPMAFNSRAPANAKDSLSVPEVHTSSYANSGDMYPRICESGSERLMGAEHVKAERHHYALSVVLSATRNNDAWKY